MPLKMGLFAFNTFCWAMKLLNKKNIISWKKKSKDKVLFAMFLLNHQRAHATSCQSRGSSNSLNAF